MRKVAIFAEGQCEQIFIRHFIEQTVGYDKISFQCVRIYADRMCSVPYNYTNRHASIHFLIIWVGNDERVLSAIKDREKSLFQMGYEKIVGLRDMYSEAYLCRAGERINNVIIEQFVNGWLSTIRSMSQPSKIRMHVAVMELEAWFLAMYSLFPRLNPQLTVDYVETALGYNLQSIDPELEFVQPTKELCEILQLFNMTYDKSYDVLESLCSRMQKADFQQALENGRCSKFKDFFEEMAN